MIFDILQTKEGFLWIATKDGLNRYDGYNFKVFSNDALAPFSPAENTVTSLFEDSRGWLWVGTESKGLDLYDRRTNRFHHFPMDFKENVPGMGVKIASIREAPDGTIWVLKLGTGLVKITIPAIWETALPNEPDLEHLTQVAPIHLEPQQIVELDWSRNFFVLRNGVFLLYLKQGLFLMDPRDGSYKPMNSGVLPAALDKILLADESSADNIWFANLTQLCRLQHGEVTVFPVPAEMKSQWTLLYPGEKGHVWFAINNQVWDLGPDEDIDFSKPDLVLDKKPSCSTKDRNGNIWIGTIGYGLRKFNPTKKLFHAGGAGMSIMGLWRSPLGKYYCKAWTRFTSIFPYDPKTAQLSDYTAFPDAPIQQFGLAFEPDGASWLLCTSPSLGYQGMLHHYGADGSPAKVYPIGTKLGLEGQLFRSNDGLLWIFGTECQLIRFDPSTAQFDFLSFATVFGKKANSVRTTALVNGADGALWIGTQLGLVKGVKNGKSFDFELIQADMNNRSGLNNNSIACLLTDANGTLWIGTKGGGINRYDPQTGQFQHITTREGLPNDVVYGILPGGKNELWCSTNRGLARITLRNAAGQPRDSPLLFDITAFTANMGLQDNEFNTSAFSKADNGELLFGGVNGLNHFFPEELRLDTMPPPVFITGLEINHQTAAFGDPDNPLAQPLEFLRELDLSYEQNNLSFEFAALDFTDPAKNRYRYRLVGLDEEWVETGTLRFAHFTHLAPGKYEFQVQGSNGESAWQDSANPIAITINPPWWHSRLAYLCYFLLLVWAGWRAYKLQIQRVKEREQLAFEQRETERVRALEQLKTNFFSNVTHEFRTPLTLIVEPLRQLLKNPEDSDRHEKIRLAERNSQRLMGLVNQLLDMAKLEGGSMTLDLRRGDFEQTVRGVVEAFLPLAAQRGVQLILLVPDSIPPLDFDQDKTEIVLNNLISNALKFTPAGGNIQVDIGLRVFPDGLYTEAFVAVKDTGLGIPADAIDKVFDRFYQVDSSHTRAGEGTGIGLALSRELAKLMGGNITVESKMGEGSTFRFWVTLKTASGHISDLWATQEQEIAFEKSAPARPANGEKPVVLVVEDNVELRNFISQSVGTAWQVVEAANGEEGVKKAIELLPDLVVSDLMMPLKDGYALCDELKTNELTAHIPIILLTAKSAIEAKLKGLRTGADDYLTKPFNTEELLARMENLVESRRKLREHYGTQPVVQSASMVNDGLSASDREFLRKFTYLLEEHLADENLGVEDFAKKMFISRVQLHRKLKAIADRSATDFIRDFRLERAHAMLKNSEGRVGEIALRVGFGNEKYFSTVFKEKFGMPPSQAA